MNVRKMNKSFDRTFDVLLDRLGCSADANDAVLISHWQDETPRGFRIQVIRKADGQALTRFVDENGSVRP